MRFREAILAAVFAPLWLLSLPLLAIVGGLFFALRVFSSQKEAPRCSSY